MQKKGDLLNQLAIIADLLEKINLETQSATIVLELDKKNFDICLEHVQKKYGKKMNNVEYTFTTTIGFVDIIFNTSSA